MRRLGILLPLALVAVTACDSAVGGPDTSRLTLLLTDAPGDFKEAVVTISSVYLQGSPTDEEDGGRVVLVSEPVTTDLLTLTQDVATLASGVTIAAGTYGQLRFVIDGAYIVVETANGDMVYSTPGYAEAPPHVDGQLMCPSCGTSGFKVNFVGGLTFDDASETMVVDFDVSESFGHDAGNSGMWVLHPSLKAASIESVAPLTVSIGLGSGVTLPLLNSQSVSLSEFTAELRGMSADPATPGESVNFTDADNNGTFEAKFLNVVPGYYLVNVNGPAGVVFSTNPIVPALVNVQSGVSTTSVLTIISAGLAN